ncbi:AraC family transcriptional regulator [Fluviicola sp.]|uniref:AraC family transcriptional regulator n=1 Tax=Fluviicola sp. TaxID=1917219 RepID=UPI003D29A685
MVSDIIKYDFKPGLPIEFEVVSLGDLYNVHKELMTSPHRTGFYHVLWFQEGITNHLVDFKQVTIEPNTILFLNKDIVHQFDTKGNFDGKAILFTDSFFCKTENHTKYLRNSILFNDLFSVSKIKLNENKAFEDLFALIIEESGNENDTFHSDILHNLLHNLLLKSERIRREQDFTEIKKDAHLDYVIMFKDLLEKEFRNRKQVSNYADGLIVSAKRLNQATSKVLGKTPKELIDERVMLEAKRLLVYTNESVKEIGFELGFEEPTNFIKYFRKHSDITPVEFREQFRMD